MPLTARLRRESDIILIDFIAGPWKMIDRRYTPGEETETLTLLNKTTDTPPPADQGNERILGDIVGQIKLENEKMTFYDPIYFEYQVDDPTVFVIPRRKLVTDAEIRRVTENISSSFNTDSHEYVVLVLTCLNDREKDGQNRIEIPSVNPYGDIFDLGLIRQNKHARVKELTLSAKPTTTFFMPPFIKVGLKESQSDLTGFQWIWEGEDFDDPTNMTIVADPEASNGQAIFTTVPLSTGDPPVRIFRFNLIDLDPANHNKYIGEYTLYARYKWVAVGPTIDNYNLYQITSFYSNNSSNGGEILTPFIGNTFYHLQSIGKIIIGNKGLNNAGTLLDWQFELWVQQVGGSDTGYFYLDCLFMMPEPVSLLISASVNPAANQIRYRQLENGESVVDSTNILGGTERTIGQAFQDENFKVPITTGSIGMLLGWQENFLHLLYPQPAPANEAELDIVYNRTFWNWGQ